MSSNVADSDTQKGTANELNNDESFQNITVFQEISQYVRT